QYDVPHGIAGGVFIGRITRINHDSGYHGYAGLYSDIEGLSSGDTLLEEEKSEAVVAKIEELLDKLEVPKDLSGFGVKKEDYGLFHQHATEIYKAAFDFNPVEISVEKIEQMLKEMIG
ncbi:MAG: iron-containing alcohol dehydrogenase, partial [Candidatus Omnitrophica bacterium]|nr:iron-containing alcohol dehydrogenase [Candidatus Omnitrophota bacterium]